MNRGSLVPIASTSIFYPEMMSDNHDTPIVYDQLKWI